MTARGPRGLPAAIGGATAVEFALVVGPLLLLLFAVVEVGRLLWTVNAVQETAIAGARCMGVRNTACSTGGTYNASSTGNYVQRVANDWGVTLTSANITLNDSASCAGVAGFSQVTITYSFHTIVPLITGLAGDPLTASACFPHQS
jgi:Flp pilus assembly protein TadG